MKRSVFVILFCLVISAMLFGCTATQVEDGTVRDTLFSVERSKGGTYGVFLTHDESVVYCTASQELGEQVKDLLLNHDGEVIIKFRSLKNFEDTEGEFGGWSECQNYYSGDGSSFVEVLLQSIRPVSMRTGEYRG